MTYPWSEIASAREAFCSTITTVIPPSRKVTSFKGTPERPLDRADLREKFLLLTQRLGRDKMIPLFDRLQAIENEKTLDWLNV